jgi:hypothetical protein
VVLARSPPAWLAAVALVLTALVLAAAFDDLLLELIVLEAAFLPAGGWLMTLDEPGVDLGGRKHQRFENIPNIKIFNIWGLRLVQIPAALVTGPFHALY